jgi:high-affinity iron transporter
MIEPKIKATDANLLIEIEEKMGSVRAGIEYKLPMEHLQEKTQIATGVIEKVEKLFSQERSTTSMVFLMSATIILREAFEAVLIVIALLSVLKSTQSKKSLAWVHGGWVAAVFVGVVFWFFSGWAMNLSGANRELLEGALTLVSALVLVYMGFWLHSKTEITKWNRFIKSKIEVALNNKSLLALSAISFIAVVREALEVVLFLRALWIENTGSSEMQMASIAGVAVAFLLVFVLSILMLRFAEKVPIRKLFNFSSAAMAVLAVIMMGKALHAIQAAGKLEITFLPVNWRFEALGFYPTIETVAGQLGLVILLVMLWYWGNRPVISKSQNQTA